MYGLQFRVTFNRAYFLFEV